MPLQEFEVRQDTHNFPACKINTTKCLNEAFIINTLKMCTAGGVVLNRPLGLNQKRVHRYVTSQRKKLIIYLRVTFNVYVLSVCPGANRKERKLKTNDLISVIGMPCYEKVKRSSAAESCTVTILFYISNVCSYTVQIYQTFSYVETLWLA
jgi:hypothetical protein